MKAHLVRALPRVVREATLEDRLLAHALLGRAYASSSETKRAERHYANVLAGWREPSRAVAQITAGDEPDDVKTARVSQALNAVGEALFFHAEQRRERADALRPPTFQGGYDEAAVVRHLQLRVTPWLVKRRTLVDEAEAAYRKVLDVQPVPPPHWIVASASQVGAMLELLRRDLEAMPIPDKIRKDPKLWGIYQEALAESLAPFREAARAADRLCVEMARRYAVKNEYSARCTARLAAAPPNP